MSRKKKQPPKGHRGKKSREDKVKRLIGSQVSEPRHGDTPTKAQTTPSEMYAANLESIHRGRQWLFERLNSSPQQLELNVRGTPSGRPTLAIRAAGDSWRLMHSDEDPLLEAAKHVETVKLDRADYLIILGFGLGYHVIEAMRRVPPKCPVFIIEQSPDIFKAAMHVFDFSKIIRRSDVKIFVGTDLHETMPALQEDFKRFSYHDIKVVVHPPSAALFPSYKDVLDNLYQVLKIVQINVNTVRFFSRIWLKNNLLNFPRIIRSPGVKSLFGQFAGKPAILVSAGPSLDKNIDSLRQAVGKAVILSADTCLRPLLGHGIKPSFVQAIDAQPITYRHFAGLDLRDVCLVGVTRLPPEVMDLFGDRVFLATDMNNRLWQPLMPYFDRLGEMGSGSTVAVLGFDLARATGCDPIIFVGQDFSYAYDRAYAQGTMVSNDMLSHLGTFTTMDTLVEHRKRGEQIIKTSGMAGKAPLLDIHGRPTEMSDGMQGWLTWFTLEIKRTKAKCINASEAGIFSDGVEVMPLEEAIHTYCTRPVDATSVALKKVRTRNKEEASAAAELAKIRQPLEAILERAERVPSGADDREAGVKWLLQQREEGQLCEILDGIIDWHKQRYAVEAGNDALKLEANAFAFACRFAIEHLKRSEALLRG